MITSHRKRLYVQFSTERYQSSLGRTPLGPSENDKGKGRESRGMEGQKKEVRVQLVLTEEV